MANTVCGASEVREWLGYVWVCLAETPPSFEDTVIKDVVDRLGSAEAIEHYEIADLTSDGGSAMTSRRTGS